MVYDVSIIGSGPAGLSAAIYAKRANLSAIVIEKEYEGTGQIADCRGSADTTWEKPSGNMP